MDKIAPGLKSLARSVESLKLDPANTRKHPRRSIEAIKVSLEKFGQQKPIVIDDGGVVIAGNGTLEAAIELGWTKIAASVSNLKGAERTGYSIADNRVAELSQWEDEMLRSALEGLEDAGLLEATGFTEDDLADMLAEPKVKDVKEQPAPEYAWVLIGVPVADWDKVGDFAAKMMQEPRAIVAQTVGNSEP